MSGLIGKTLGQYEIIEEIGRGGMATVYRGYQPSIGRTVAIKVLPPYLTHEQTFIQRFEREVKVIAQLQHPRILPVYDYGQHEGQPYIVMAYMPGGTLADLIEREGPLPLDEVIRLTKQIAEGLDFAQRKGVIHRDFKPSNVLLDDDRNAHLADFGIAKISESTAALTGSAIVGTPSYMAPEMAESGDVSPSVDIYALGITMYQMLAGQMPFSGDTPLRVMMAHIRQPAPDVRDVRPDLPPGVSAVVIRAMAKRPNERYATAGELAEALEHLAEGPPIEAKPPEKPEIIRTLPIETAQPAPPAPPRPPTAEPQRTDAVVEAGVDQVPPHRRSCMTIAAVIIGVLVLGGLCVGGGILVGRVGGARRTAERLTATAAAQALFPTPTPRPIATRTPRPTPTQPATPARPPTPTRPSTEAAVETSLRVENRTPFTLCTVHISPVTDTVWGRNWLGSATISPSEDRLFSDVPAGDYDLMARDCDSNVVSVYFGLRIPPSGNAWQLLGEGNAAVVVVNDSSEGICTMNISPTTDTVWGPNWLAERERVPQDLPRIFAVNAGMWDLRAVDCAGNVLKDERNVAIDAGETFEWHVP